MTMKSLLTYIAEQIEISRKQDKLASETKANLVDLVSRLLWDSNADIHLLPNFEVDDPSDRISLWIMTDDNKYCLGYVDIIPQILSGGWRYNVCYNPFMKHMVSDGYPIYTHLLYKLDEMINEH